MEESSQAVSARSSKKLRVQGVLKILKKTYPQAHCELTFSNPLQLLVATILSAQCTDVQVNKVTPSLFEKYKKPEHYAQEKKETLERAIRRIGLFRSKAKNIKAAAEMIIKDYGGEVPQTMESLVKLPGVGRKTANVVLGNAFDIHEGFVVDTHIGRITQRLGFTKEKTPQKIELDLMKLFPRQEWTPMSHRIIWHGRRRCYARSPDCLQCELKGICPSFNELGQKKLTANKR